MKTQIIIFLLMSLISCTKSQTYMGKVTTAQSLYVVIGESNSGGRGINANLSAHELAPRSSLKILNNTTLLFEDLDIGTNNLIGHSGFTNNASHGIENGLANCNDTGRLKHTPIYLVKRGQGGTQINHWNNGTLYLGIDCWAVAQAAIDTAKVLVTAINGGVAPEIRLIWFQGINNALIPTDTISWKTSTKAFFVKFRLKYGANCPIFMTYIPSSFDATGYNRMILAMESEVTNFHAIQVSDAPLWDSNHWNEDGFKLIATKVVDALISFYNYKL